MHLPLSVGFLATKVRIRVDSKQIFIMLQYFNSTSVGTLDVVKDLKNCLIVTDSGCNHLFELVAKAATVQLCRKAKPDAIVRGL